jgi:hypothetical protein
MNVNRKDKARSSAAQRYILRGPAACGGPVAEGQAEAARMVREHASTCPNPGPAWRPVSGGAAIRPLVYADQVGR